MAGEKFISTMRNIQIRNILSIFRTSATDEAIPIAKTMNHDHGTISRWEDSVQLDKSLINYDRIGESSELPTLDKNDQHAPMSLLRKAFFGLSLNFGFVYVAVILWFIPCRGPDCQPQNEWITNVSGVLTSNMAIVKSEGMASGVISALSDNFGSGHLSCLAMSNGVMNWNTTSDMLYRHIFCEFQRPYTVRGLPVCLTTGYNFVHAISSLNGERIWQQHLTNSSGETVHQIQITQTSNKKLRILGLSDTYLFVFDAATGFLMSSVLLPCSWTLQKKLLGPWTVELDPLWLLLCDYGDSVEMWRFQENEIMHPAQHDNNVQFRIFYSRTNSVGSIDLASDVTRVEDFLVLSWTNMVVMATVQAPLQHLQETWERTFDGTITSMTIGHFSNLKEKQIAVAVRKDSQNTQIHILETRNGSSLHSINVGLMNVMSMKAFSGGKNRMNGLYVESIHDVGIPLVLNSTSSSSYLTERTYSSVQYNGHYFTFHDILSAEVSDSVFISDYDGAASLILSSSTSDGRTLIRRERWDQLLPKNKTEHPDRRFI